MAKPSAVLACVVVVLSVALFAILATGLGIYLGRYKDDKANKDLDVFSALGLDGYFMPLLGIPLLLLSLVTLCCVAPADPSKKGRTCLGLFWFLTALVSSAAVLVSLLGFLLNRLLNAVYDACKDDTPTPSVRSPDCDEIINVGRYLSIATAVICAIVAVCAVVLCCFGCCFQEVDEDDLESSVRVI